MKHVRPREFCLDQAWVRRSFDRSAHSYDAVAVLQREVADRLLQRLDLVKLQPQTIVDVGTGTGYCARALSSRYPQAHIFGLDLSAAMLHKARQQCGWWQRLRGRQHYMQADAARLPLRSDSVDLIVSSLTLQWCNDLDTVFAEFYRVLKPGGLLMFSSLGPDTLRELRQSWRAVDAAAHVNAFMDMHDVGDAMLRARLADPVMDVENICLTYAQVSDLMRDLKGIGSRNASLGRAPGLTGKQKIRAMTQVYERYRVQGMLPANYEVVYGHAWIGDRKFSAQDRVSIPVQWIK